MWNRALLISSSKYIAVPTFKIRADPSIQTKSITLSEFTMPASKSKKRRGLEFVDKALAEQYICSLCFAAMTDPASIGCSRQHLFCKKCIVDHLEHDSTCPQAQCKEKCLVSRVKTMPVVKKKIDKLQVRCPNHRLTTKMKELLGLDGPAENDSKIKRSATMPVSRKASKRGGSYSLLDESEAGPCTWTGTLADYEAGKHSCDLDMITCPRCKKRKLKRHLKTPCPKCKQAYVGCQKHECATSTCGCCQDSPIFAMF